MYKFMHKSIPVPMEEEAAAVENEVLESAVVEVQHSKEEARIAKEYAESYKREIRESKQAIMSFLECGSGDHPTVSSLKVGVDIILDMCRSYQSKEDILRKEKEIIDEKKEKEIDDEFNNQVHEELKVNLTSTEDQLSRQMSLNEDLRIDVIDLHRQLRELQLENSLAVYQIAVLREYVLDVGDHEESVSFKVSAYDHEGHIISPPRSSQVQSREEKVSSSRKRQSSNDTVHKRRTIGSQAVADRVWKSLTKPQNLHNKKDVDRHVYGLKREFNNRGIDLPLYPEKVNRDDRDCAYRLGTRKIHLNYAGGRLVIRLGGGYQDFLEFLDRTRF